MIEIRIILPVSGSSVEARHEGSRVIVETEDEMRVIFVPPAVETVDASRRPLTNAERQKRYRERRKSDD